MLPGLAGAAEGAEGVAEGKLSADGISVEGDGAFEVRESRRGPPHAS